MLQFLRGTQVGQFVSIAALGGGRGVEHLCSGALSFPSPVLSGRATHHFLGL